MTAGGVETRFGVGVPPEAVLSAMSALNPERDRGISNSYLQGEWRRQLSDKDTLRLRYFHVHEHLDDVYQIETGVPNFYNPAATIKLGMNYHLRLERDDLELEHTLQVGQTGRMVWGLGWRRDKLHGKQYFGDDGAVAAYTKRLFGHYEWRLSERWLLNAGATWENESLSGSTFAPRVMASYRVDEEQTLRFGGSRAYQIPAILEQRAHVVADDPSLSMLSPLMVYYQTTTKLRPEQLDSLEIGYLGEFRPLGLTVDARLFDEHLTHRITGYQTNMPGLCFACNAPLNVQTFTYINGMDTRIRGLEYQLRWHTPWSAEVWFKQAFLRLRTSNFASAIPDAATSEIRNYLNHSAPSHEESIHWMQKLPRDATLTVSYSQSPGYQWGTLDPARMIRRLDWRIALPFRTSWGGAEVALVGRGTNGAIYEFGKDRAPGGQYRIDPRYWLNLRLEF